MRPFDQALKELDLTYAQTELIKQAVEEFVIGEDEKFIDIPVLDHLGDVKSVIKGESFMPYMIPRNTLRATQRQALRGTK